MSAFNESLQSVAVDLLQALIARGEIDVILLQTAESAILGKLYCCVHTSRLDLQNKLLHLLHSTISAFNAQADAELQRSSRIWQGERLSESSRSKEPLMPSYSVNPLLIQTLIDGITASSNRPILQHWLDFILMTVPQFHDILQPAILPLNECVCRQLRSALAEVTSAARTGSKVVDVVAYTTDADFVMLLNAVERLALISLSHLPSTTQLDDDMLSERPNQDSGGLLGYVSNVFGTDTAPTPADELPPVRIISTLRDASNHCAQMKFVDCRCLHESVRVLYAVWEQMRIPENTDWESQEEALSLTYNRTRSRCRRVFEHLFRAHPLEVLESVIDCWSRTHTVCPFSD